MMVSTDTMESDKPDICPAYCFCAENKWGPCTGDTSVNGCCSDAHAMHLFMVAEQEYSMYIDALECEDYEKAQEYHTSLRFKSMVSKNRVISNEQSKLLSTTRKLKNHFRNICTWKEAIVHAFLDVNFDKCEIYKSVHVMEKKCLDAIANGDKLEDVIEKISYYKRNTAEFFKKIYSDCEELYRNKLLNRQSQVDKVTINLDRIERILTDFKKNARATVGGEIVATTSAT